jgi:hypothetical protein
MVQEVQHGFREQLHRDRIRAVLHLCQHVDGGAKPDTWQARPHVPPSVPPRDALGLIGDLERTIVARSARLGLEEAAEWRCRRVVAPLRRLSLGAKRRDLGLCPGDVTKHGPDLGVLVFDVGDGARDHEQGEEDDHRGGDGTQEPDELALARVEVVEGRPSGIEDAQNHP